MEKKYKVTAVFEVYDQAGNLIDGHMYVNKVFEGNLTEKVRKKAIAYTRKKVAKKYGKSATFCQIGNQMVIRRYYGQLRPKKSKSGKQLELFNNN